MAVANESFSVRAYVYVRHRMRRVYVPVVSCSWYENDAVFRRLPGDEHGDQIQELRFSR